MANKQGKVWGSTSSIFHKNNVEVHRIEGKVGGFSSSHIHLHKFNLFVVESGKIKVSIKKEYGLTDDTILGPGESCEVEPNEYHKFEVLEDCVVYEFYWVQLDPKDIQREDIGGVDGSK